MSSTVPATTPKHILVAEGQASARSELVALLTREGFRVSDVADGSAAFDRLREGGVDVVLIDVKLPAVDGAAFVAKVVEAKIPTSVVMMSSVGDIDAAIKSLKAGALDYVTKPCRPDEVLLKITRVLELRRVEAEREQLKAENARLKGAKSEEGMVPGIIGKSPRLHQVLSTIRKVAEYKSTVLLIGESGTGKELMAHAVHDLSPRKNGPFVAINCGAIPETLLESELFGHVKGAFTDASRNKLGLIEEAQGGTLFLDEIGELPLQLQVKLLRFLQEDEIRRVGDTKDIKVDVRVVGATARDLSEMVKEGTFREDLYYRLNVLQLRIPPLRERKDDIPTLVEHFVAKYADRLGRPPMALSREALAVLLEHPWPGNVRELENTIERAMVLADGEQIGVDNLPDRLRDKPIEASIPLVGDDFSLKHAVAAVESELIKRALAKTAGNRTKAAELLDISHRALLYKLKEYGI